MTDRLMRLGFGLTVRVVKKTPPPTHRTPSFEELFETGMEFELCTPRGWVSGTYPTVLDKNPELDEFGDDYEQKLAHAICRVPIQ